MINIAEEIVPVVLEGQVVELEKSAAELLQSPPVTLKIDGIEVRMPRATLATDPNTGKKFPRPTTIYDAAIEAKVAVPVLCHRDHMTPAAVCRMCTVEVGGRVLAAACHRAVEQGLDVKTHHTSPKVKKAVGILTELLLADTRPPGAPTSRVATNCMPWPRGLGSTRPSLPGFRSPSATAAAMSRAS